MLATRPDGLRNILGLGCGQHEDHVPGRLFQCLQEGIEGGIGDLVSFVKDVNLETVARRTITCRLPQLPNLVDAAVSGGVDLDHIDRVPGPNFRAGFANAARFRDRVVLRTAIQGHGQNTRDRGLSDPPMTAEDVAMGRATLLDSILQGPRNMFLSDDFGELLRTVFARQNLIAHRRETLIIRECTDCSRPPGSSDELYPGPPRLVVFRGETLARQPVTR